MFSTFMLNTLHFSRIIIFAVLIFIMLPIFILKPKRNEILEFSFKYIGISVFSCIIVTYVLLFLKLYGLISFSLVYVFVTIFICFWIEGSKFDFSIIKKKILTFAVKVFDYIEGIKNNDNEVDLVTKKNAYFGKKNRNVIFTWSLIFIFLYIILLRLIEIMPHTFLYYSDSYGHLMITKLLLMGQFMTQKFYPVGYHCIISAIKIISFSDFVNIIRFLGPIQWLVIIFSIYWFVLVVTKNKYAALLAAALLGLDSVNLWPAVFYRQLVALPQEFATIFFLPAVYFCLKYIRKQNVKDLKYTFIFISNILLIHFYVGILLLCTMVGIFLTAVLFRLWKKHSFIKTVISGIAACLIGSIPFIIWYIFGLIFNLQYRVGEIAPDIGFIYRYINFQVKPENVLKFIIDLINPLKDPLYWHNQWTANLIIYSLIASIAYLFFRYLLKKRFFERHYYLLTISISQVFFVILYYGFKYDLLKIMYFERVALILSICGVVIMALLFNEFFGISIVNKSSVLSIPFKKVIKQLMIVNVYTIVLIMIIYLPYEKSNPIIYQHEGCLKVYYQIKSKYELLDWTIVSPVEDLSLTQGYGYHYELIDFLNKVSFKDAKNRNFDLGEVIPSENIFIYLEKNPLLVWYTIPNTVYDVSETEYYYRTYHNRVWLQGQLKKWMNEYLKSHQGLDNNAKVFYEDNNIIVYYIKINR